MPKRYIPKDYIFHNDDPDCLHIMNKDDIYLEKVLSKCNLKQLENGIVRKRMRSSDDGNIIRKIINMGVDPHKIINELTPDSDDKLISFLVENYTRRSTPPSLISNLLEKKIAIHEKYCSVVTNLLESYISNNVALLICSFL